MRIHSLFKNFACIAAVCAVAGSLVYVPVANAAVDPCAMFYSLRKDRSYDVVKVQVLGVQNGVAGVMILGLPKRVNITLNGMDVSHLKSDSRPIQCGREQVGELSSYDLRSLNIDAGYFEVQAGNLSDALSVQIPR